MSSNQDISQDEQPLQVAAGSFLELRPSLEKGTDVVVQACGHCSRATSAVVPREEHHVVTVGSSVGILTPALADASIAGVTNFSRRKVVGTQKDALKVFMDACMAGSVMVKEKGAK